LDAKRASDSEERKDVSFRWRWVDKGNGWGLTVRSCYRVSR
jgi:hypothetical protein